MADKCKTCKDTGFIKVQRAEMLCPDCLRIGADISHAPVRPRVRHVPQGQRDAARGIGESQREREIDIQGGELYD
jgi:hypothetical protein